MANEVGSVFDPAATLKTLAGTSRFPVSNTGTDAPGYQTLAGMITYINANAATAGLTTNAVIKGGGAGQPPSASGIIVDGSNNASGFGTIASADQIITSAAVTAFAVGRQGSTNPAIKINSATVNCVTGIEITSAAAAGGCVLAAISSGTNESLTINAKGTGLININNDLVLATVGNGIRIKEGTNAAMGIATLTAGTVTVNTTKVTANSRIFLTANSGTLTNIGFHYIGARVAGTSFTITSSNVLDTSNVAWEIKEPAP